MDDLDADHLFLRHLHEMDRLVVGDTYDLLLLSGFLRNLFVVDRRLLNRVNRARRVRLTFEVRTRKDLPGTGTMLVGDDFFPDAPSPHDALMEMRRLGLDRLCAEPVLRQDGKPVVTVRQAVKHLANTRWNHFDLTGESASPALGSFSAELDFVMGFLRSMLPVGETPADHMLMRPIARIILRGVEPLRAQTDSESGPVYPSR